MLAAHQAGRILPAAQKAHLTPQVKSFSPLSWYLSCHVCSGSSDQPLLVEYSHEIVFVVQEVCRSVFEWLHTEEAVDAQYLQVGSASASSRVHANCKMCTA